ncbi:MAG: hypothetical protein M1831_001306 [Alyxoria varia]|nr:MAG: hypothetical protein M1831_001306 [Alyxoria varia]
MEGVRDDNSARLVVLCFVMIALSTVAIILRVWSRALQPRDKFQADDWTALAAFPFVIAALSAWLAWAVKALGQHNVPMTPEILKIMLSMKLTWDVGIALSRISAIFFYRRVFFPGFIWRFWIGIVINVAWFLMLFFYVIFSCNPPKLQWDNSVPGKCQPELPGQVLSSLTSVVIDLYILVMPIPTLWKLHMKPLKRVLMVLVFLLGYTVPVLSLGRFATTMKTNEILNDDPNWGFGLQGPWSILEVSISFIGITIPGIFFLVKRGLRHGFLALFDDREYKYDYDYGTDSDKSRLRGHSTSISSGGRFDTGGDRGSASLAQRLEGDVGDVWIKQEMSVSVDAPGATGSVTPRSIGKESTVGVREEVVEVDEHCGKLGGNSGVTYNAVAHGPGETVEKGGGLTHAEVDEEKALGL